LLVERSVDDRDTLLVRIGRWRAQPLLVERSETEA